MVLDRADRREEQFRRVIALDPKANLAGRPLVKNLEAILGVCVGMDVSPDSEGNVPINFDAAGAVVFGQRDQNRPGREHGIVGK